MRATSQGLTLIELLVAIAVFALLGLMSYQAIYSATESQGRLSEEYITWQRISRALNRVENELMQLGVRSFTQQSKTPALMVSSSGGAGTRLAFWRLDAAQGAKLSGLEYADERLILLRWKTGDLSREPTRDVLLEGVKSIRWQFAARGEAGWRDTWPVSPERNAEAPEGVRIEMELDGKGRLSRVFALR
jgi:general secretion pathway protein J